MILVSEMSRQHTYTLRLDWTGNTGEGTRSYRSYSRNHQIQIPGKPAIEGSSDPAFRGDPERYNPEELFLASLSSCHMLWFLHLCADNGIVVTSYRDEPEGTMEENTTGGKFTAVTLKPVIKTAEPVSIEIIEALHEEAHRNCFIANSVNFPIRCESRIAD